MRSNGLNKLVEWRKIKWLYRTEVLVHVSNTVAELINKHYKIGMDVIDHADSVVNIESFDVTNSIESEHFFVQHFRIPILEGMSLSECKIAQIAYNAGQFKAEREKGTYLQQVLDFYYHNKLGDFLTFVKF